MDKYVNLLYFSATGCTAKVVKEVANNIGEIAKEYDITLPVNREKELVFDSDDLVVIGVPVYSGRIPGFLTDYFTTIKGNMTKAVFIVVYGNRDYDDALLELKDVFESKGFIPVAAGAFIGEHSYSTEIATGRPDIEDLKIASELGVKIKQKLNNIDDSALTTELKVKGNFPYKEKVVTAPMAPETDSRCTECGICAEHCPAGAINFYNFKDVDASRCVKCCRCIKNCPQSAKSINHETFKKITQMLINNFRIIRREPELFI